MNSDEVAGAFMLSGAVLVLFSIALEFQIGWIGVARDTAAVPSFLLDNWDGLKSIWSVQMAGHALLALAYLLLLKNSMSLKATLWAGLFVTTLLVVIAFGITIGGYQSALRVYETQPEIFGTLGGAVRGLYSPGVFGALALLSLLFLIETFSKHGRVGRPLGLATLVFVTASVLLGLTTSLTVKATGASVFLLPMVLGYALLTSERGLDQAQA